MESGGAAMAFLLWDEKIKIFCGKNRINTGLLNEKFEKNEKIENFFQKSTCILEKDGVY